MERMTLYRNIHMMDLSYHGTQMVVPHHIALLGNIRRIELSDSVLASLQQYYKTENQQGYDSAQR
jgi:hypothetical protein